MDSLERKRELLEMSGYVYNFDRDIYVNRKERKAFSIEFVEDCTLGQLRKKIEEPKTEQWQFYFNSPPAPAVIHELEQVLA